MSHVSQRTKKVLGALVVVGMVAGAARFVRAADRVVNGKVGTIVVAPSGDFTFHLEGFPQLCNTTPSSDELKWVTVTSKYATSDGKRNLLSSLTSAKLAGRSVSVFGLNNATAGEWGCRLEKAGFN